MEVLPWGGLRCSYPTDAEIARLSANNLPLDPANRSSFGSHAINDLAGVKA
jgi:hypothetical protein